MWHAVWHCSRCSCNLLKGLQLLPCSHGGRGRRSRPSCRIFQSDVCFIFANLFRWSVTLCRDEPLWSPGQTTGQWSGCGCSLCGVSIFSFSPEKGCNMTTILFTFIIFLFWDCCPWSPPPSVPPSVLHNIVLSACLPSLIITEVEVRTQQSEANRFSFGPGKDFPCQGYTHCCRAHPAPSTSTAKTFSQQTLPCSFVPL